MTRNSNALETIKHSTSQFEYSPHFSASKKYNKLSNIYKKLTLMSLKVN